MLGIILVGYTVAGNGTESSFGKFASATVDTLNEEAGYAKTFSAWTNSHRDYQKILEWPNYFEKQGEATGVSAETAHSENPLGGNTLRVNLTDGYTGNVLSGIYSPMKIKKKDGTYTNHLEPGKKYSICYYARGKGKWLITPEQNENSYLCYNLSNNWQLITDDFTTRATNTSTYIMFIIYSEQEHHGSSGEKYGKAGDWCEVTDAYLAEI